jgi:hypothetical protein
MSQGNRLVTPSCGTGLTGTGTDWLLGLGLAVTGLLAAGTGLGLGWAGLGLGLAATGRGWWIARGIAVVKVHHIRSIPIFFKKKKNTNEKRFRY